MTSTTTPIDQTPTTQPLQSLTMKIITRIYQEIEFTEEEITYLIKQGYRNAISIINAFNNDRIYELENEKFPAGLCAVLHHLGAYFKYVQEYYGNLRTIEQFSIKLFELFNCTKVFIKKHP